jgi:hypothetical protein
VEVKVAAAFNVKLSLEGSEAGRLLPEDFQNFDSLGMRDSLE